MLRTKEGKNRGNWGLNLKKEVRVLGIGNS